MDPRKIPDHAQDAEPFLSLFFRQDVCDHRIVRRMGNARKQTNDDH
jgi:hypothetical protein